MIVKTIVQIQAILSNLASEVEFKEFEPYLEDAEDWIDSDLLGTIIYEAIEDGSNQDSKLKSLVEKCCVLKAYELGIPYMDLLHTSSGFAVVSDKNKAPASDHRTKKLIAGNKVRLGNTIERLFNYLEDTPTYHTDWKSSPAYSLLSDCLILTARELKRFVKFEGNRNDFILLKPTIINETSLHFFPNISRAYTKELIDKQNADTLTPADKNILLPLKQALANLSLNNNSIGNRILADTISIMDRDLDSYPTYRDSEEKLTKDDPGFVNTAENPMFVSKGGM